MVRGHPLKKFCLGKILVFFANINNFDQGDWPRHVARERRAEVVKLVDTRDLKSLGLILRAGSSPALGIIRF